MRKAHVKYNPKNMFLGPLCNHGHEFGNTGQSLRYKQGNTDCVICTRELGIKYRARAKAERNKKRKIKIAITKEKGSAESIKGLCKEYKQLLKKICTWEGKWKSTI